MPIRPATKILIDGGNPDETTRIRNLLGFLDGQTTNPTLISKNPDVQRRIASGHKLSEEEQKQEYKLIVQKISPLVGDGGVSIEVFADFDTTAEQMLEQGREMFSWIPNAYVKYPCTHEGLRAAQESVKWNIRVNMTLCFSQEQAAAVYSATKGARQPVYVSPFVGRLDDRGQNGMELVKNIKKMYEKGDGHVHVLTASIRKLEHLLYAFALRSELATAPANILEIWAASGTEGTKEDFHYSAVAGRGVRTVQRYEVQFGFPIHRPAGTTRSAVLAFSDEVEAWLRQAPVRSALPIRTNVIEMPVNISKYRNRAQDTATCPFCHGTGRACAEVRSLTKAMANSTSEFS